MFFKKIIPWKLLAKTLSGENTGKENDLIQKWLQKSPQNREIFNELEGKWQMLQRNDHLFDADRAWNRLHKRITTQAGGNFDMTEGFRAKTTLLSRKLILLRVAAAVFFVALLGTVAWYFFEGTQQIEVLAGINEQGKVINLPDGSVVTLNAQTSIRYKKQVFGKKSRDVLLTGEAFFEVQPDSSIPFNVFANHTLVSVKGTSFNVKAGKADQSVRVFVSSGVVEISLVEYPTDRVRLTPGYLGILQSGRITTTRVHNENSMAWKTGSITFRGLRLPEVVALLNELYGANIVCGVADADSVVIDEGKHFRNESLDVILSVICTQSNIKFEKSDDMIYLSR